MKADQSSAESPARIGAEIRSLWEELGFLRRSGGKERAAADVRMLRRMTGVDANWLLPNDTGGSVGCIRQP